MNRRIHALNLAMSADVRMTGGLGEEVHLHFGSRSSNTRLECIFRGRGYDDFLLHRYVDGSLNDTATQPLPFPFDLDTVYRIRAEWLDNTVTFWIGTNELVKAGSVVASAGIADGLAGLCTYRTTAVFDNVRFEPLASRTLIAQEFGPGTNLVSFTAYDTEGQTASGTATLVMLPGDPPTADAGGPYAVDELTGDVVYNGWRVLLDGRGSSDPTSPTNRLSYLWDMGAETFDGTAITPGKWIVSAVGVSQNGALSIAGANNWGTRYAFARTSIRRAAGTAFEASVTPPSSCHTMVGLKNTSTSYSYSAMPYAFYFHDGDYVEIYEDGSNRGRVALYTPGVAYDVRIDLKAAAGARYYLRPSGAEDWQLLYDSGYGTGIEFLRGLDVHTGTVLFDDLRELAPGQVVPWRFYGTNAFAVELVVTDPTGVADTNATTATTSLNDPPGADGGIDVEQGEADATDRVWTFFFDASGSADDGGILSYEWDWDYDGAFEPSGVVGATASHTWAEPGVYTVAVRVTDHALQTHLDTVTVTVTLGDPPSADPGGPYEVDEFAGAATNGAWTVALDGGGSADAESSLVQYVWTLGRETFETNRAMDDKWCRSADAFITNGALAFAWLGASSDSGHYCFTRDRFQRVRGLRAETRIRFPASNVQIMFGFKNDNETSTHWNQWIYALHNHNGTLYYCESGGEASLGRVLAPGVWYDWRIELKAVGGARYYVKRADEAEWALVRDSTHSAESWFRRGYHDYYGSFEAESYEECAAGPAPVYRVYAPGTNDVSLTVWDQALQTNTVSTTLACLGNEFPVAVAGPDRFGTETNCTEGVWFFTFDASGSSDDHGIYRYEWDWDYDGDFTPSGDTGAKARHGFSVQRLGTNTVAVRVVDHVLQETVDTCRVVLVAGEPPAADAGGDHTVETGWPLTFDGTGSTDDTGVSRYVWDFGDGATGAGPQPRHIYRAAAPTDYTVVLTVYDATETASAPSTARVSVVTSTAPEAEAGGPYAAGAGGPPAYFDGSASSDALDTNVVQGVAQYLWDVDTSVDGDGDGTKDNDVDLIGRRPFHVYASAGSYVCKLTVVDAAGQSDADLTTVDVAANLAPHVICVPLHGNPDSPHLVYEGKTVTLKGLVRDAGTLTYSWDFGDGSTTAVATVTDKHAIQATHAYAGPPDRPFLARLTVWDAAGLAGTDEYRLVMRPDSQTTRAEIAVDEGLWWLHKNQNRATGYWNSPTENNAGYRPSAAAAAVQALLTNGHRPEGDPTEDPYVETVNRGFDYLFSTLQTRAMSVQTAGDPDTNGNGIGWRYDWNYGSSDNSISQWGAISLLAADNNFGIQTPPWVISENKRWLTYSFVGSAYCYRPAEQYPWAETSWHSTQPSAMIQMAVDGIGSTNATWRTAEMAIADNWASVYGSAANRNYYSLYGLTKAMRLARPRPVVYLEKTFLDWYHDPAKGVQQKVAAHQAADGSWSAWYRDNGSGLNTDLSTAWAVMMLTPTLFSQAPVPVITAPNVWGFGVPMGASAEKSFHIDSTRHIVKYEWDFDGGGSYDIDPTDFVTGYEWDFDLDEVVDAAASWPTTNLLYAEPGEYVIALRVWDGGVMNGGTNLVSDWGYAIVDILPYDADGDGISDKWERAKWGDLTTATASSDYDEDGFPDLSEFGADTDPLDEASKLAIESIGLFGDPPTGVDITWQSVTTRVYRVERSMDLLLQGGGFELLTNGVPGQADTTTVIDPAPSEFKGFYRIAVEAP